ncbi:30S ribosomal protein S2 [Patescibacteria group bacterium]
MSKKEVEKKAQASTEWDFNGTEVSLESMLKAGVHFGHLKSRRNPKMSEYIFGLKNGVNIINLEKSLEKLNEALAFIEGIQKEGKQILFVGTKKQAKGLTRTVAEASEMPFVVERWLGGTFTNFRVIRGRAKYLKDSQDKLEDGSFEKYTKLEKLKKEEEIERLERKMGGIKNMTELPAAIFVVGVKEDSLAVEEAKKAGVPVIGLIDTNNDPSDIDYEIPANDDAISSIRLILGAVAKTLAK